MSYSLCQYYFCEIEIDTIGTNEADEIDTIVLEEFGLTTKPRTQDDKRKFDNMVVQ
jgi:hypothetical protein